jgi:hypothetical protein
MTMNLARRVLRLEAGRSADNEIGLEELIERGQRSKEWRESDDPENLAFLRRWENSRVRRLWETYLQRLENERGQR